MRRATRDSFNSGSKNLKWVTRGEKPIVGLGSNCDTRGPEKPVLDLGPNGDTCMGFPNIPEELTNPIRLEVGESSSLAGPRPTTHKAHDSVTVASSKTTMTEPKLMKLMILVGRRSLRLQLG